MDLSTTTVGFAVLDTETKATVELGHFSLKKVDGLFEKAELVISRLLERCDVLHVDRVWIEEPVSRFTPGMSSAHTIVTLMRFNGVVSYGMWRRFGEVSYAKPGEARRSCGVTLTTRAKSGGRTQKQQTFDQLTSASGLLSSWSYARKRNGDPKPEAYDEVDAYVIARHGAVVESRR